MKRCDYDSRTPRNKQGPHRQTGRRTLSQGKRQHKTSTSGSRVRFDVTLKFCRSMLRLCFSTFIGYMAVTNNRQGQRRVRGYTPTLSFIKYNFM
jgi:hypothetical protein